MRARRTVYWLAVLMVAAVVLAAACSAPTSSDDAVRSFTGLDGASLYAQACASCHGAALAGTESGPPLLDAVYERGHHADAAFLLAVRRGVRRHHWNFGNMPPIEGLNDEQVAAIVDFVRGRQAAAGIE